MHPKLLINVILMAILFIAVGSTCVPTTLSDAIPVELAPLADDYENPTIENEGPADDTSLEFAPPEATENPEPEGLDEADSGEATFSELGIWERTGGTLFDIESRNLRLTYIEFEVAGLCTAYFIFDNSGIVSCLNGSYERTSDGAITLDIPDVTWTSFEATAELFALRPDGDDVITIASVLDTGTFERREQIAPNMNCRALNEVEIHASEPFYSGLVLDDERLWVNGRGCTCIRAINSETGAMTQQRQMDGQFWDIQEGAHWVGFGSNYYLKSNGENIDYVSEYNYFDADDVVSSIVVSDLDRDALYLFGRERVTHVSASWPHEMVSLHTLEHRVIDADFDGREPWVLINDGIPAIARLDPETMEPIASYRNPDPTVSWTGIATSQAYVYLSGRRSDGGYQVTVLRRYDGVPTIPELPDFELPF